LTFSSQPELSGVAKGVFSLLRHTAYGASNSVSKCFESVHKGMLSIYVPGDERNRNVGWKMMVSLAKAFMVVPSVIVGNAASLSKGVTSVLGYETSIVRKRPPRCFVDQKRLT
jgi:hypothetical protein